MSDLATETSPNSVGAVVLRRLGIVLAVSMGLGVVAGIVWWAVTPLPSYVVQEDGYASIGERGLALVFAGDAVFTLLGIVVGALIGITTVRLLARRLGWLTAVVVLVACLVAAVLCWGMGILISPGDFDARLVAAVAGSQVPIDLRLRSPVALAVWPFIGLLPLLLWATLVPDPAEPRPIPLPWRGWLDRHAEQRLAQHVPPETDDQDRSPIIGGSSGSGLEQ